ncbi:MAG: LysR substrate-binding domain-containing protein [Rhizobiaceae bacterium]|nr:LysR substrate-binding domain-containing protein [Rhizobiaceae bacterium]
MINITLKQLRYFDILAKEGHFGRAAEKCAISQPALSMQIKELEEILGTLLIERSARNIRLTGFGERFLVQVREVLKSVDELGDMARAAKGDFSGQFRLGIIPTVAPYLLPKIMREISLARPGLETHVRETQTQRLVEELLDGNLDAAILALPVSESALMEAFLFTEEFVLVRSTGDADKQPPNQETLKEMKLLLLEEGHCFRDQALSFCSIPTNRARETLDGSSLSTLVQMVSAGMGVTFIPEMAVDIETRSADVLTQRFDNPKPTRTIGMVWRKTNPLHDQLVQIAGLVRKAATQ